MARGDDFFFARYFGPEDKLLWVADQMEDTRLLKRRCLKTLSKGERGSGSFLTGKGMTCLATGLKLEVVDVLERMVTLRAEL